MAKRGENIYKRKDGRWEGRYIKERNSNGKIRYGYIYSKKYLEVKQKLMLMKAEYLNGVEIKEQYKETVTVWLDVWLETIVKPRVKLSTYNSYKSKVDSYICPIIGHLLLRELAQEDIEQLVIRLGYSLSSSSIHAVCRVLKTGLRQAVRKQYISKNPAEDISLPKLGKRTVSAFSKENQWKIQRAAVSDIKYLPIILSLETGMRIGEICALKWSDIDFQEKTIHIKRTLQRLQIETGKTAIIEGTAKTAKSERVLPLSNKLANHLIELKESSSSSYVISLGASCTEPRTINYRFKKLLEELAVPNLPFHALRHTFATRCLESGINVATISSLLGHTSIKMTLDVYTNSFLSEERKAIELMSNCSI